MSFFILDQDINHIPLEKREIKKDIGGIVTFEGRVRAHNLGKVVRSLEYEAYPEMANREGQKIVNEALQKFAVTEIICVHRTGHLQIGDLAVWIWAGGGHRKDAFLACQYVIDQLKERVPIWKKEHYVEGQAEWAVCPGCQQHKEHHHHA